MNDRPKRQQHLRGFDLSSAPVSGTDGNKAKDREKEAPAVAALAEQQADKPAEVAGSEESLASKTVYLVDAHSLIYQVFHALPEMTGPSGQPVSAIYGFLRDLADLLERRQPDYLLVAFDAPGKTFRHKIYDQYKATRPEMPLDLQLQIPNIQRFLDALSIPVLSVEGYEADDILATIAAEVERRGGTAILVTSDKDCRQLISDRIKLYDIRRDEMIDAERVRKQWNIEPAQVVDFQALWGDSTDNIPGVPGIGKKTAAQLLNQFGSLDGIYDHIDQLPANKRTQSLIASRELAETSRKLVQLDRNVPVSVDWRQAGRRDIDGARVRALCKEFGFQRLGDRLVGSRQAVEAQQWTCSYQTITTLAELEHLASELRKLKRISVDTETTSVRPRWAELVGCSIAWEPGQAAYVPVRAPAGDPQLELADALRILRPVLEDPQIEKVGQNLKYDLVVLRKVGVRLDGVAFDTMVADYLLNPGHRSHSMDDLAQRYLNHETTRISALIGKGKQQKRMDEVAVELVAPYAAEDADVPLRLAPILDAQLQQSAVDRLFYELEVPLIEVLAEMEYHGIALDVPKLTRLSAEYAERLAQYRAEIFELAGESFNIDSPKQLSQILFGKLGLPAGKRTKTGFSTDADVLRELAVLHPLPAKILEYRSDAKLKNTYIDALPTMVHPETGRIHTSFKQDVAATGRLSSTDPNLQNIPVRTEAGRAIRSAFVAGPRGWQLVCADYSQIELRVLAHYSQDEALLRAFANDLDIHAEVAAQVHNIPLEEVTPDMRRQAKAVNFGVIYGQSAFGLAKSLGIQKADAAAFIEAYFARYPGVSKFMEETLDRCLKEGYVSTALGRRRVVRGIRAPAQRRGATQRNMPERIAINTVIQGSAADLIKQAMVRVYSALHQEKMASRMLLQIHDELVFEAPPEEIEPLIKLVRREMIAAGQLDVPLKVDVKVGPNWADCKPWKETTRDGDQEEPA